MFKTFFFSFFLGGVERVLSNFFPSFFRHDVEQLRPFLTLGDAQVEASGEAELAKLIPGVRPGEPETQV